MKTQPAKPVKHTEGEWTYGKTSNFEYFDIDCNGNRICSVYCGIDTPIEEQQEAEATAGLICSAPELLRAILAVNESLKANPVILAAIREFDPNLEDIINEAITTAIRHA